MFVLICVSPGKPCPPDIIQMLEKKGIAYEIECESREQAYCPICCKNRQIVWQRIETLNDRINCLDCLRYGIYVTKGDDGVIRTSTDDPRTRRRI